MTRTTLTEAEWRRRRHAHERRVDTWTAGHRTRRSTATPHPVEDFLFTYYSYRPARLRRWHPGAGVVLAGADPGELGPAYAATPEGAALDVAKTLRTKGELVTWVHRLLTATASRAPRYGCFGLHEWAMVYRQAPGDVRHRAWPLRLSPAETAAVVDRNRIACTHFDAFRFFTPAARPLNLLQPARATQPDDEQPGCLHANMDLYKWAYKLSPLVASETVADCFELARDVRALDMRASPYDLAGLGYPPVRVETPEGRAEYVASQRRFADRAARLRARLIEAVEPWRSGADPVDHGARPGGSRLPSGG